MREMWAYDFMTPPSRKLVQLWNNQDPNSPLLKDAWPTRISVQPIQSGTGNNTSGSNHRDISALISAKWGGTDGGRRHRRTVEDVARDAPTGNPLKAQIGNSLDTTKRMYIDDIVARRLQLRRQPVVFIFSAFRGREWEKEMAKRMPAGTLLWCVEWEDREAVRQEFTDAGLAVTFLEARSRVDRGLQSESLRTHNVGGKEGSWIEDRAYSWLGATYLGVSPWYRIKGDYGRDIAVYSAEDTIVASIRQIYEQLKNAAQPPQKAQEAWAAFGVSPYLVFDVSGRPAFYVSRMDNTQAKIYGNRFLEGNNTLTTSGLFGSDGFLNDSNLLISTKVWNQNRLLQILITDPTSNSFGPVLLETSSSLAVPADIIEIRHPMLVYYNDETSATYVHYGLRCNPKDIFAPGKWEQHTGTPPNVTMNNDQEAARRRTFEGMFAYNADFIRNVHAIIRRQQHNEYLAFLNMRPPPPVEDPGPRPIEPQAPQQPNISLPVPPTRRVVHVQMPPLWLPRWKEYPFRLNYFTSAFSRFNPVSYTHL
ncbi:MAG: hypothetical protein N3A02_05965, partial [Rectinema sp.]|nr:hypothetical protein [Rectinema sp.]